MTRRTPWPPLLIGALLLATVAVALTLTGPSWSPASPFTNNTLNCSWSYSIDASWQNITIYRNGVVFNTTFQNASDEALDTSTLISAADTTKNDAWICSVTISDNTTETQVNTTVTILNTPPTTEGSGAGIFNQSGADVGFLVQIPEDVNMTIDVNATDADADGLTYLQADEFCTRLSSSAGTYSCLPTQSYLSGNLPTLYNITFTMSDGQNVGGRTITFNVTPVNDAPTATVSSKTTSVNQSLNATFTATDIEENYPLSFILTAPMELLDKLSISRNDANGTSFSIHYDASSPDYNDIGLWNVTINITDNSTGLQDQNDSMTAIVMYSFNVTPVGRRPYFVNITPTGQYNLSQGQSLQINISANDSDANSTIVFTDDTSRFAIGTLKTDTNTSPAIGQINFTPTNADVGLYNVTITITDQESLTNTTILTFNVTNVNDAPQVHEISDHASNTGGNLNASELAAYENAPFVYVVNATDPDTIHGDSLTFADNTSLFAIDASTGAISFTPTGAQVGGPYHINISVVDEEGLSANRTIILTINSNSPPRFNLTPLPALNCTTDALCVFDLAGVAEDPDGGDSVASYDVDFLIGSIGSFAYNTTNGLINFTTQKYDVGNATVNITITDTFGASNWTLMNVSINNTPVFPNLTRYNFSDQAIVELHGVYYELQASDRDFLVSSAGEQVTFTTNLSFSHTITPMVNSNITARAILTFTPPDGSAGNYSVQINATDAFGLVSQQVIVFEVLPDVPPPDIVNITPWGLGATYAIQTTYADTGDAQFLDSIADVNMTENSTVLFNASVDDTRPLTYNWTFDGVQVANATNYTRHFNFSSNGTHTVRLNVSNDRLESSLFTWALTVRNVNRAPYLNHSLSIDPINTTTVISSFFIGSGASTVRFYDPDDDDDDNRVLDGNETNRMTFSTQSSCSYASFSISGTSLTVTPLAIGNCTVYFNATDPYGATVESNAVSVVVTDVPEGETETVTVTSSGGGGGSTTSTYIPIARDKETPKAFQLIAPKLVTIYSNNTIQIPITVNNTWNADLKLLRLTAETNATGVRTSFDTDLIEVLPRNSSQDVVLTVTGYRMGENYEVKVTGNVSDPDYRDTALILLNSLESSSDGDEVNVKVTFANDLLNEHPECQELNEVLDQAKQRMAENDLVEARRLVDGVINGCRYLVSTQQRNEERPSRINPIVTIDDLSLRTIMWSVLAFVVLLTVSLLAMYHYTHRPEDDI